MAFTSAHGLLKKKNISAIFRPTFETCSFAEFSVKKKATNLPLGFTFGKPCSVCVCVCVNLSVYVSVPAKGFDDLPGRRKELLDFPQLVSPLLPKRDAKLSGQDKKGGGERKEKVVSSCWTGCFTKSVGFFFKPDTVI